MQISDIYMSVLPGRQVRQLGYVCSKLLEMGEMLNNVTLSAKPHNYGVFSQWVHAFPIPGFSAFNYFH